VSKQGELPAVTLRDLNFTLAEAEALVMAPPKEGDPSEYWTEYAVSHIMREVARNHLRQRIKDAKKRQRERARRTGHAA
jgi:hypothetical protein